MALYLFPADTFQQPLIDVCIVIVFILFIFFFIIFFKHIVSKCIVKIYNSDEILSKKLTKEIFTLFWHTSLLLSQTYIVYKEDIYTNLFSALVYPFYNTIGFYEAGVDMSLEIKLIYLFQMSYYLSQLLHYYCYDPPSDPLMMYLHHFSAFALILLSYSANNFWRIGIGVLWYHEYSDIVLSFSKCCHYTSHDVGSSLGLVVLILVWFYTRLIAFPVIGYSGIFEVCNGWSINKCNNIRGVLCNICSTLLVVLYIMHYWWFYLINKVLVNGISSGRVKPPPEYGNSRDAHYKKEKSI